MTGTDVVSIGTDALFILSALAAALAAARLRRSVDLDAALMLGLLALLVVQSEVTARLGITLPPPIRFVVFAVLVALPYLQLRVVDDFTRVPHRIRAGALGAFVMLLALIGLTVATPLGSARVFVVGVIVLALSYFIVVMSYAGVRLLVQARRMAGLTRSRVVFAALGALFLALVIAAALLGTVNSDVAGFLTRGFALASAVSYLLGFAPPPLLRQAVREPLLRAFLIRILAIPPMQHPMAILRGVEREIEASIGRGAEVQGWLYDDAEDRLRSTSGLTALSGEGVAGRAFATQRPVVDEPAAGSAMAAPMSVGSTRLGVMVVRPRGSPLFVGDSLEYIALMSQQAALVLQTARAYGAIHEANLALEAQVAELARTNAMLDEATRAKSQFLANMSHELRTPLNAILGFTDLLSEQLGDTIRTDQRRYLGNVRQAGDHLLGLINDLLDLAKVEAGRVELRPEPISLESLVEPVAASTRAAAEARGITFDAEIADAPLRLDPARIRQILYNLLSNAVKFTPPGGRVTLGASVDDGSLAIRVSDTGIGIPTASRDRLFGAFERLHEGVTDAEGAGLGLALTKQLVQLQGGTIDVDSVEGEGTTFHVRLFGVAGESVHGDRLLIVEDVRADADLVAALATEVGLRCEVVGTASAALEAIRRDPPRAIVLDLRLPDARGEVVLDQVKRSLASRQIPVIVVTVEDDAGTTRPRGADDHLTKPIDGRRLGAWLRAVAAQRLAAAGASSREG